MAALKQQVLDVSEDVKATGSMVERLARIETTMVQVDKEIIGLREAMRQDRADANQRAEKLTKELKDMREEAAANDRDARRTLKIGLFGLATAVITAAGGIVAAGVHP